MTVMEKSGVTFQPEFVEDSIQDAIPLIQEHWDGLEHYANEPLDLDVTAYKKLDDACLLRVFTARESDGAIVGYCVFFVKYSFMSKKVLEANQMALFIKKGKRGFGIRFIKWCDDMLKKEGINIVYQHIPDSTGLGPIFERIGYKKADVSYARRLI